VESCFLRACSVEQSARQKCVTKDSQAEAKNASEASLRAAANIIQHRCDAYAILALRYKRQELLTYSYFIYRPRRSRPYATALAPLICVAIYVYFTWIFICALFTTSDSRTIILFCYGLAVTTIVSQCLSTCLDGRRNVE